MSVDSKPQDEEEKEQSKLPQEMGRLPEKTEARFPEVSSPSNSSSSDDKLSKLVTFVVGLETEIHWNKCKPKKDRKNSSESENEMKIVNISSTQRSDDPSTETPSDSSGSDSEDSLGMIRLERVYYSASPHVKSPNDVQRPDLPTTPHRLFDASVPDSQSWTFSAPPVDRRQTISGYNLDQSDSIMFRNKARKDASVVKKNRKTSQVPCASSGITKRDAKIIKGDESRCVKRKKIQKKIQKKRQARQ